MCILNKKQTIYWPRQVTKENINPDTFLEQEVKGGKFKTKKQR